MVGGVKAVLTLIAVLFVGACSSALRDRVVGTYEFKRDGNTGRLVLLVKNRVTEAYINGKKYNEGKWGKNIDGEILVEDKDGNVGVLGINKDGSLTLIAEIDKDGKRKDATKEDQYTLKKIK